MQPQATYLPIYTDENTASSKSPDFFGSMVENDLHGYMEQLKIYTATLQKTTDEHLPADQVVLDQRKHVLEEIHILVEDQLSAEKKEALFAFLTTQQHLFQNTEQRGRGSLFFYLLNHFPLTIFAYEDEVYERFPSLKRWLLSKSLMNEQKKTSKNKLINLFVTEKELPKKPLTGIERSLLGRLAMKIDPQYVPDFVERIGPELQLAISLASAKENLSLQRAATGYARSTEAIELAKKSNGKIILRVNDAGNPVIDFPEIDIKGAQRLVSSEKTNFQKNIVQGDHKDKYGHTGIKGLTYMTGKKAMQEAKKQGLKLFSKNRGREKTKQLLATLGTTGKEQTEVLSILFGSDLSGAWEPNDKKWRIVGSRSYLGLSEVTDNGYVCSLEWSVVGTPGYWSNQDYPQPFLAFEEC